MRSVGMLLLGAALMNVMFKALLQNLVALRKHLEPTLCDVEPGGSVVSIACVIRQILCLACVPHILVVLVIDLFRPAHNSSSRGPTALRLTLVVQHLASLVERLTQDADCLRIECAIPQERHYLGGHGGPPGLSLPRGFHAAPIRLLLSCVSLVRKLLSNELFLLSCRCERA